MPKCIFLLLISILVGFATASIAQKAVDFCGPPPPFESAIAESEFREYEGELKGELTGALKLVGNASGGFNGKVSELKKRTNQQLSNPDTSITNNRILHVGCLVIFDDGELSSADKFDRVLKLKEALN
jgi:hypothetical protein